MGLDSFSMSLIAILIVLIILLMVYVGPMVLLAFSLNSPSISQIALALLMQYIGLLAERWMFFAEANHPQNLYYQRVS